MSTIEPFENFIEDSDIDFDDSNILHKYRVEKDSDGELDWIQHGTCSINWFLSSNDTTMLYTTTILVVNELVAVWKSKDNQPLGVLANRDFTDYELYYKCIKAGICYEDIIEVNML